MFKYGRNGVLTVLMCVQVVRCFDFLFPKQCFHYGVLNWVLGLVIVLLRIWACAGIQAGIPLGSQTQKGVKTCGKLVFERKEWTKGTERTYRTEWTYRKEWTKWTEWTKKTEWT